MTISSIRKAVVDTETGVSEFIPPPDVPVTLVGSDNEGFTVSRDAGSLVIEPMRTLVQRHVIRPAVLFDHGGMFPEMNTVMGRLLFPPGSPAPQRYRPFTRDAQRRFREVLLSVEPAPDDDLPASATRWRNCEFLGRRILAAADVPWTGLADHDIARLLDGEPWLGPIEGCVLHALTRWAHARGECVIEIGSLHGQSLSMIAMALEAAGGNEFVVSIDPHGDHPEHADYVRLALSKIGQGHRLMQIPCISDRAHTVLRPNCASLIFIDGDHSYDQVVSDFKNYSGLLAPGGVMAFHDYGYGAHNGRPDVVPGVRRAIDEYVMTAVGFKPLLLAHTLMAFVKKGA